MNLKRLIEKYATSGPRYTSYPTAVHFVEEVDKTALVADALEASEEISLYVHIPYCASLCYFCACSSFMCADPSLLDNYLDMLEIELSLWREKGFSGKKLGQIHFGGGTPNILSPIQIGRLGSIINKYFEITSDCEFSVELDPRTLNLDKIKAFVDMGINRVSFGLQDTNEDIQKAINRIQPKEMNSFAFESLRACGIKNINADLVYGLPMQSVEVFAKTLDSVIELNPTRLALFNYAHVPWLKPAQKRLEKYGLPSIDEKLDCFIMAKERFEKAGYEYIGLDHFAKPDDELILAREADCLHRNFQGYSTRAGLDSFGIGLTSISETAGTYRQNYKDMKEYKASLQAGVLPIERGVVLTKEDSLRRKMIMSIMCKLGLDSKHFLLEPNYCKYFDAVRAKLEAMQADGLLVIDGYSFALTDTGRIFMRNIAMLFDGRQMARHSTTI
ncbi:MAG: oxygen-independent coproporphyrinogen III oxidase [Opitutales bacterium]